MSDAPRPFIERLLDLFFERADVRHGCGADGETGNPIFLKRWFVLLNPDASTPPRTKPRWNLTIRRPGIQRMLLIHKFLRSDADRELHDHPWPFLSVILWRGYVERTECRQHEKCAVFLRKLPGMVLFRAAEHRHRVLLVDGKPSWSLVITGRKSRSWGFWRDGVFIPWRTFVNRKCEGEATRVA